jgi:HTH-like domain
MRRLLLTDLIAEVHERSRGTYGMLRVTVALRREHDMVVNKKLVWSIMSSGSTGSLARRGTRRTS